MLARNDVTRIDWKQTTEGDNSLALIFNEWLGGTLPSGVMENVLASGTCLEELPNFGLPFHLRLLSSELLEIN